MSDLPEIYDRFELEEQLRNLQQKIDDLKTQVYFTPQSSAPVDVEVGTLAYSDGTNTDNTFGNSAEGFYYYASGTTWTPISVGGSGNTIIVQDEGTPLSTSASTLNFVGSGVAATGTGATKTITINSGGASTDISPVDESSDTTCFPIFVTDATGETRPKTDADSLTYNASTGEIGSKKLNLTDDLTMSGSEKKIDFTDSTARNNNEPSIQYAGKFLIKSTGSANTNDFSIINSGNNQIFNAILETSATYTVPTGGPSIKKRGIEVFETVAVTRNLVAGGKGQDGQDQGTVYIGCELNSDGDSVDGDAQLIFETHDGGDDGSRSLVFIKPPSSLAANKTITLPSSSGTLALTTSPAFTGTTTVSKLNISDNSSDNVQLSITNGTGASLRVLQTANLGGTVIDENGTASLTFKANDFFLQDTSDSTNRLSFNETTLKLHDGDGNIVLQTATGGVDLTGRIKITPQSAAPTSPTAGMIYYDSDDNKLKLHNGTSFVDLN